MEAKRRALDEIAGRHCAADEERNGEAQHSQAHLEFNSRGKIGL
jgi:hypothetical protein